MATEGATGMLPVERRAASGLASIFAFRMVGLFMLLPVLSLYAEHFTGTTPLLMGLALGIYGLTQALFQIPFGMLSDRFGRKLVIAAGLLIFAAGSVVAALATTIEWVVIGRALQGAGAIAAASMALLADLTREEVRTRAMAVFGMTIGFSFMLAIILGPLLNGWIGVSGIFWVTAVLALVGLGLLYGVVPNPVRSQAHHDAETDPGQLLEMLQDRRLQQFDIGIFILHLILTALFVAIPLALRDTGLPTTDHGWVYLGVMVVAVAIMVPLMIVAERRDRMKEVFLLAIGLIFISQMGLWGGAFGSLWGIVAMLTLFFAGFNLLEATLPSLISRVAPVAGKGTAMGIYSSAQFLGTFLGGLLGGGLLGWSGEPQLLFLTTAVLALGWWGVASTMDPPPTVRTRLLHIEVSDSAQAALLATQLQQLAGVVEAVVIAEEQVAYLKVDRHQPLDEKGLASLISA